MYKIKNQEMRDPTDVVKMIPCWKICILILLFSYVNHGDAAIDFNYQNQEMRQKRETHYIDARSRLGRLDIGPSFRNKRDNAMDANEHAKLSVENSLDSAAESLAAAEMSITAGLEAEESRIALQPEKTSDLDNRIEDMHNESSYSTMQSGNNPQLPKGPGIEISSFLKEHKDGQLQKLMTESSELGKELRMVFDILSKRESQLIDEMNRLKSALTGAISVLKHSSSTAEHDFNKRNRREFVNFQEPPYKACVYIESLPNQENVDEMIQYGPPEPRVREFIPDQNKNYNDYEKNDNAQQYHQVNRNLNNAQYMNIESERTNMNANSITQESSQLSGPGNDIDLSKVYWIKLPDKLSDESVHAKVESVFGEVGNAGKDVLIIPVSRDFTSKHQVSQGFLKAFGLQSTAGTMQSSGTDNRKHQPVKMGIKEIKV